MQRTFIVTLVAAALGGCSSEIGSPALTNPNGSASQSGGSNGAPGALGNGGAGSVSATSNGSAASGSSSSGGSPVGTGSSSGGSGAIATGGGGGGSSTPDGGAGATGGLPCDVQTLLANQCQSCHSSPPLPPAPMALVTYSNLMAPSIADMTKNYAQMSLSRMQNTAAPMPPAPAAHATAAQIATLQNWIAAGYPMGSCGVPSAGGSADGGSAGSGGPDAGAASASPYATPVVCTSMASSTGSEGATMRPGEACVACHSRGEGPRFQIAGTLYPTAHEPDDCHGVNGSTDGATVVIIDSTGATITLTPNAVGNFSSNGNISTPFQAKVVQGGKERIMVTPQTSGDCNSCHTETGANGAPGRIMLP